MSRILITSGPTREYLDPVRFLSNASSGRMGKALASAAIDAGHEVVIVSGPVELEYPAGTEVIRVVSTQEMLEACLRVFPHCGGLIAVAAPCDYRPVQVARHKLRKTGRGLDVRLEQTPDIVATLGRLRKAGQWMVAFALETEDPRLRAMEKLARKRCDLIVVNGPAAMQAECTAVEMLDRQGRVIAAFSGSKTEVGRQVFRVIEDRLIRCPAGEGASG